MSKIISTKYVLIFYNLKSNKGLAIIMKENYKTRNNISNVINIKKDCFLIIYSCILFIQRYILNIFLDNSKCKYLIFFKKNRVAIKSICMNILQERRWYVILIEKVNMH